MATRPRTTGPRPAPAAAPASAAPAAVTRGPRTRVEARFAEELAASHRGDGHTLERLLRLLDDARAAGDDRLSLLVPALYLLTSLNWGNFRRFPEMLAHLAPFRDPSFSWRGVDEELLALSGLLTGLLFFAHDDPFIDTASARIKALLERDIDVNIKLAAGRVLLYYAEPRDLRTLGQHVFSLMQPCVAHPAATPHRVGYWLIMWERLARGGNDTAQAALALAQCRALAEAHGLRDLLFWLTWAEVGHSVAARDIQPAERSLAAAEANLDPAHLGHQRALELMKSRVARLKGQADLAVHHGERATQYSIAMGEPPVMQALCLVFEAQARLLIDDFTAACAIFRRAAAMVPALYADEVRDMGALTEAYAATLRGDADGRDLLAAAWAPIRERQYYDTFEACPEFGAKVFALTLAAGVEVEFVRRLVEVRGIPPPANAPEAWPWPVRIRALGGFSVECAGEPLVFKGKAQRKPVELLKVLTAHGGRPVAKARICELMWPGAGKDPAATLDVTLWRLRKLLGDSDAIVVDDGKVGVDPARVWVDAWAFDRDVEVLQDALQAGAQASTVEALGQRLLSGYRGPFLGDDEPPGWSLKARARWQNRFRRSLADVGRFWEQHGRWDRAIALYERALEEDGSAEELYRQLMRAHLARGEPAEAARAYRRCREMLSALLGIRPAADTEALFHTIYAV